ncbi:hypothetical protein QSH57_004195 [Fusarium oxysporum f. sp. vasinfectum]|nr:hypothetical protein QSH57_004195 [Fusarium oxysporum f. sp. vasinfectum]
MTYEEIAISLNRDGFRVKPRWIQHRVTERWGGGKNFTKKRTMRYLQSDAYDAPALDFQSWLRLTRGARRNGINMPDSHCYRLRIVGDQYLAPSPLYTYHKELFSAVSKYVDGAFDNQIWSTETFSNQIAHDFMRWTYDDPPSIFKVFGYLMCATVCSQLEMHREAQLLLKTGFNELPGCIDDHSPATLLVFIVLLRFFYDRMPTERERFLHHSSSIAKKTHPFGDILCRIYDAEHQGANTDSGASANLLHDVAAIFYSKLKGRLGSDKMGYVILQPLHQGGTKEDFEILIWNDPSIIQREDKNFFNSDANIERYVVLATEKFGYRELLQIEKVLRRQRSLAETSETLQMIDKHLASLQRPIQRIGFRDYYYTDRKRFQEHWKQTTTSWEMTQVTQGPNHIMDMLQGMKRFKDFEDQYEVSFIKKHLYIVFLGLAEELGTEEYENYKMAQDGILHLV